MACPSELQGLALKEALACPCPAWLLWNLGLLRGAGREESDSAVVVSSFSPAPAATTEHKAGLL